KLPFNYLAMVSEAETQRTGKNKEEKTGIDRTKSNPEKNAVTKGGSPPSAPIPSRNSGELTLIRVVARNSLERRGSSSPNVVSLARSIFGKSSAERVLNLTPNSVVTFFKKAPFYNQLGYLAILTDTTFARIQIETPFLADLSAQLRKMNTEQFKSV